MSTRPYMISELASIASTTSYDLDGTFKYFLRLAERYRKQAKEHVARGELEEAFVLFARSASIVLEKLPGHKEYTTALSGAQRNNLTLNGQEILDNLGHLKPILLDRFEQWCSSHPDTDAADVPPPTLHLDEFRDQRERERAEREQSERELRERELREQQQRRGAELREQNERERRERELKELRDREQRDWERDYHDRREWEQQQRIKEQSSSASVSAVQSAMAAAGIGSSSSAPRNTSMPSTTTPAGIPLASSASYPSFASSSASASHLSASSSYSSIPSSTSHITYPSTSNSSSAPSFPSASSGLAAPPVSQPGLYASMPSINRSTSQGPTLLPLENPLSYDDDSSTDNEQDPPRRYASPMRDPRANRNNYPPPVTTMSPPPTLPSSERIEYPRLMNGHQKSQGYRPSRDSMFVQPSQLNFAPMNPSSSFRDHYNLPPPSQSQGGGGYNPGQYRDYHPLPQPPHQLSSSQYQPYPPPPISADSKPSPPSQAPLEPLRRPETPPVLSTTEGGGELKNVLLPRSCLPRFLTIAKVNTSRDRETCGLLLGKLKDSPAHPSQQDKYIVTTLLIPKQHSTSDTCTMDEEELILQVTEERGLITLGWIHTHPSQSCFMSSVDLHTHSAFQRMLPESFAVVCAPTSVPNFGIFRLTDPPGLNLILACNAKEAFHPHPDAPIYTDAERGHVQMKDLNLEIIDLR